MKIQEHNCATGEITLRDLTPEEIAQREAEEQTRLAAVEAHKSARQALLDKLGITEEEARLLLG